MELRLHGGNSTIDIQGSAAYDIARKQLGGSWVMPSKTDFEELMQYCTFTQPGYHSVICTGPNGRAIEFISSINLWTSTPNGTYAYYIGLSSNGQMTLYSTGSKTAQYRVRPIIKGDNKPNNDEGGSMVQGHEAIDLGLSVKWASCNIGAAAPEDYGSYFAWGEPTAKESFDSYLSELYGKTQAELQSLGVIDQYGNLCPAYDAATVNYGTSWRMPTYAEMQELLTRCTITNTTRNGIYGSNVTGPNGKSIFLPSAGFCTTKQNNRGTQSYYWSSSLVSSLKDMAYSIFASSSDLARSYDSDLYLGHSVRPVTDK